MATPKQFRRRGRFSLILGTIVAALTLGAVLAYGDNLTSDAATTAGITTITAGGSTTITYQLVANSAPSGDVAGCDATSGNPVTVTINAPGGVSAPSSLSFTGCGNPNKKTATFSSNTADSYNITHSISGGVSGSKFNNNADFTLTVNSATPPNTAPSLSLPADITAEATGPGGAAVNYSVSASDAEDNPDPTPSCSPASDSTFPLGLTQVNCSVTDSGGLETIGMFNVTVQDTTPPSLNLPSDITKEATSASGAAVSYSASATDLVDVSVAVNCSPASGSTFALGTTTVDCDATDAHGNPASGSFTVTVQDTTPPTLTLPANITTTASSNSSKIVNYSASATDLVDGPVTVACALPSGSSFPVGTTTVNCSATDAHSNPANGSFTVTVSYNWAGFFQPIDNGVMNVAKAGSTIPVKFSLSGNQGLNIYSSTYPNSASISCSADPSQDAIEEYSTGTVSGLKYDAAADQYIYNWKTASNYAGTCRQLIIRLADGAYHRADFKFTK